MAWITGGIGDGQSFPRQREKAIFNVILFLLYPFFVDRLIFIVSGKKRWFNQERTCRNINWKMRFTHEKPAILDPGVVLTFKDGSPKENLTKTSASFAKGPQQTRNSNRLLLRFCVVESVQRWAGHDGTTWRGFSTPWGSLVRVQRMGWCYILDGLKLARTGMTRLVVPQRGQTTIHSRIMPQFPPRAMWRARTRLTVRP